MTTQEQKQAAALAHYNAWRKPGKKVTPAPAPPQRTIRPEHLQMIAQVAAFEDVSSERARLMAFLEGR